MIAVIAPAIFNHVEHERYTVNFDAGEYSMKYAVITVPHDSVASQLIGETIEKYDPIPVAGKVDFVLRVKAGEPIEVIRDFGALGMLSVKTPYKAKSDIEGRGTMHYHSYLKADGIKYVCNL